MGRVGDWFCGPARGLCPRELWGRYSDKPCFLRWGITETQQTVNGPSIRAGFRLHSGNGLPQFSAQIVI